MKRPPLEKPVIPYNETVVIISRADKQTLNSKKFNNFTLAIFYQSNRENSDIELIISLDRRWIKITQQCALCK